MAQAVTLTDSRTPGQVGVGRRTAEAILRPLLGGLLLLLALIGLIGTAIKNPQPHDIQVGLVGPAQRSSRSRAGSNRRHLERFGSRRMGPSMRRGPRSIRVQ